MAILTNKQILALAKDDPTYKSWTSKLTDEIFENAGFEELANNNYQLLADFFNISVRVILQKIQRPKPRIPQVYRDIVEEYPNTEGGIFQRINTKLLKPTSPKFRGLVNGGSVDPFVVRKPETEERFYKQNFDFQNLLTIQEIELKKMFLTEGGINDYITGILSSLDDSYNIQKYELMREVISKAINSTNFPLKASQIIETPKIDENADNDDQAQFLQKLKSVYNLMTTSVVSGKFNAKGYEHGMYPEEYVLLCRADVWEKIQTELMATTYHTENLNSPFKVDPVKDFGGLIYKDTSDNTLLPVYDSFGTVIGFNESGEGDPLDEDDIVVVDPNEKVQAMLVKKGFIFTTEQDAYQTRAIVNPAGLYTNFWASQPNSSMNYDACYDVILFVEPTI